MVIGQLVAIPATSLRQAEVNRSGRTSNLEAVPREAGNGPKPNGPGVASMPEVDSNGGAILIINFRDQADTPAGGGFSILKSPEKVRCSQYPMALARFSFARLWVQPFKSRPVASRKEGSRWFPRHRVHAAAELLRSLVLASI